METCRLTRDGKELPVNVCPICGYEPDAATCVDGSEARPKPGDVTLCFKCGEIMEFNTSMLLVPATVDTLNRLQDQTEQWHLLTKFQKAIREKRPKG